MECSPNSSIFQVLEKFEQARITLVEWETPLLCRLGYPLALKPDLLYLIPDEKISEANEIAAAAGLQIAGYDDIPASYLSEHARQGFRYVYKHDETRHRLVLVPLSWTGIHQEELQVVSTPRALSSSSSSSLPCTVWTVSLSSLCAAYLRIIIRENINSLVCDIAIADLSALIGYSMFDMTYEGNYMITPEDSHDDEDFEVTDTSEKDAIEMKNALEEIRGWHFKEDDEWARDTLLRLVSGDMSYDDLPAGTGHKYYR